MLSKRQIRTVGCKRVSHPEAALDLLSALCAGAAIGITVAALASRTDARVVLLIVFASELAGIGIGLPVDEGILVVVASAVIDFEFALSASYTADVVIGVRLDALTTVCSDNGEIVTACVIGGDMLAEVKTTVSAAVMPALKFIVPTS